MEEYMSFVLGYFSCFLVILMALIILFDDDNNNRPRFGG